MHGPVACWPKPPCGNRGILATLELQGMKVLYFTVAACKQSNNGALLGVQGMKVQVELWKILHEDPRGLTAQGDLAPTHFNPER